MYSLASKLASLPIVSLQTGEAVASVIRAVIDSSNLEVIAYLCEVPKQAELLTLITQDIRQITPDCFIIDSEDELAETGDIVRIRHLLEQNYTPLGKLVVTDLNRHLGRIDDYTINLDSHRIQKLYVRPSLLRFWLGATVIVDRTQIIDVTPRQIVVRDTAVTASLMPTEPTPETNP